MGKTVTYTVVALSLLSVGNAQLPDPDPDRPGPEHGQAGITLNSTASGTSAWIVPDPISGTDVEIPPPPQQRELFTIVGSGSTA